MNKLNFSPSSLFAAGFRSWSVCMLLFMGLGYTTLDSLQAQRRFEGALIIGGNASQISRDDLNGYNQFGINAGARVVARVNDRFSFGPEILFSQYGSRRQNRSINISNFESIRLNTIEVPVMAYFKDWRITAEAGLSYSRLINYEIIDIGGETVTEDFQLRENMVNIQLGATYFLTDRFGLNFRWSRNLINLDQDPNTLNWRNFALSFRGIFLLGADFGLPDRPVEDGPEELPIIQRN